MRGSWRLAVAFLIALGGLARAQAPPPPPAEPMAEMVPAAAATVQVPNKVKGLELPATIEVEPRQKIVTITPKFDSGSKPADIKWGAIGSASTGEVFKPDVYAFGLGGVIVAAPDPGEIVIVHAVALISGDKPWLTEPAYTLIIGKASQVPAPTPPVAGPTPPRPPPVVPPTTVPTAPTAIPSGLSVVLVLDVQSAGRELAELTQSPTLRAAFTKAGSKFFAYDKGDPILVKTKIAPVVQRLGQYPALVVIANGGKTVLPAGAALPLPLQGTAAADEAALLTIVSQAAGGGQ